MIYLLDKVNRKLGVQPTDLEDLLLKLKSTKFLTDDVQILAGLDHVVNFRNVGAILRT